MSYVIKGYFSLLFYFYILSNHSAVFHTHTKHLCPSLSQKLLHFGVTLDLHFEIENKSNKVIIFVGK